MSLKTRREKVANNYIVQEFPYDDEPSIENICRNLPVGDVDTCIEKMIRIVRVLDLSRVLTGPYCAQLLADQGAQVIKVETPGTGDENRVWCMRASDGITSNFHSVNRGITLNLKSEAAREVLRQLIAKADVVIQSFLPESAARSAWIARV